MSKSSKKDQPEIPSPQGFVLIVNRRNKTTFIFFIFPPSACSYIGAAFIPRGLERVKIVKIEKPAINFAVLVVLATCREFNNYLPGSCITCILHVVDDDDGALLMY